MIPVASSSRPIIEKPSLKTGPPGSREQMRSRALERVELEPVSGQQRVVVAADRASVGLIAVRRLIELRGVLDLILGQADYTFSSS
jgi:hypothetical protein